MKPFLFFFSSIFFQPLFLYFIISFYDILCKYSWKSFTNLSLRNSLYLFFTLKWPKYDFFLTNFWPFFDLCFFFSNFYKKIGLSQNFLGDFIFNIFWWFFWKYFIIKNYLKYQKPINKGLAKEKVKLITASPNILMGRVVNIIEAPLVSVLYYDFITYIFTYPQQF